MIEINNILYDTENHKLAKVLETLRLCQAGQLKRRQSFRIKVEWVGSIGSYEGYIETTRPYSLTEWDREVAKPVLVWKTGSRQGRLLEPSLIKRVDFASNSAKKKQISTFKTTVSPLFDMENQFFSSWMLETLDIANEYGLLTTHQK